MTSVVHAAVLSVAALGAGGTAIVALRAEAPELAVPDSAWETVAVLDGKVFYTTDTIRETGEVLQDRLTFRDGTFQSEMCQVYCDFGWTEYRTMVEGDRVRFHVITTCPEAPHTVEWLGTVTGDTVTFEAVWTSKRWYWTRHLSVFGAGSTTPPEAGDEAVSG